MKRKLLLTLFTVIAALGLQAQVTQINSNRSLHFVTLLTSNQAIYVSDIDSSIWVTDGSLVGTTQISTPVKFVGALGSPSFLSGKLIFAGYTVALGVELYITDGTAGGTGLVSDINPGTPGSTPDNDVAFMGSFIYFTAERAAEGRELWRTDGTSGGTTLVKDIVPGLPGSNTPGNYHLFSNGTYLLFAARTASLGIELWRSNGTDAGTVLLLDINTGNAGADSSNPAFFYPLNNLVLFQATNSVNGREIWRTDGTPGGTTILMDINPGLGSATSATLTFGPISFEFPLISFFHTFNNRAYFNANDGTNVGGMWVTDGTPANTSLVKVIIAGGIVVDPVGGGATIPLITLVGAINLPNKFIFSVCDVDTRSELWESDGTPGGTVLFRAFSPPSPAMPPFILLPFGISGGTVTQPLFQGNKFFFVAGTATEGIELWVSDGVDGTAAHTNMVRDINLGNRDMNDTTDISYIYTSSALYFPANSIANGPELWKSDGTFDGTSNVADIVTGLPGSDPHVNPLLVNGKILFEANNGDSPTLTDLYAVDGTFTPLPIKLGDFTVMAKSADAVLNWRTLQEINAKNFTVQRSFDGRDFQNIGTIDVAGTSSSVHDYSFIDPGIMNSGKSTVYYRLLTTDKDGKTAYSPVIVLKISNTGNWNVRLLVNPIPDNVKIVLSGITQNVQVSIIDMNGKKLYTNLFPALNGQISLPAASLPRGTYMLMAETGKERKTIQFVK